MNSILKLYSIIKNIKKNVLPKSNFYSQFLKLLKWQITSRLIGGRVIFDWVDNSKLIIEKGDTGLTGNIYCGLADPEEMLFLIHVLRSDDLFIDVGANQGAYTVLASAVIGANSVAFEPIPGTVDRLRDQIRINNIDTLVKIIPNGVGDVVDNANFSKNNDTINKVIIGESHSLRECVTIEMTTLDTYFINKQINSAIVKIDVEGYEFKVLMGARKMLGARAFLAIIIEINGNNKNYGVDEIQIDQLLKDNGYQPITYDVNTRLIRKIDMPLPNKINTIYIRDFDEVSTRLKLTKEFKLKIANNIIV
jgi:FkbM family methyltransferase